MKKSTLITICIAIVIVGILAAYFICILSDKSYENDKREKSIAASLKESSRNAEEATGVIGTTNESYIPQTIFDAKTLVTNGFRTYDSYTKFGVKENENLEAELLTVFSTVTPTDGYEYYPEVCFTKDFENDSFYILMCRKYRKNTTNFCGLWYVRIDKTDSGNYEITGTKEIDPEFIYESSKKEVGKISGYDVYVSHGDSGFVNEAYEALGEIKDTKNVWLLYLLSDNITLSETKYNAIDHEYIALIFYPEMNEITGHYAVVRYKNIEGNVELINETWIGIPELDKL